MLYQSVAPECCTTFYKVSSKLEADAKLHPKMEFLMPQVFLTTLGKSLYCDFEKTLDGLIIRSVQFHPPCRAFTVSALKSPAAGTALIPLLFTGSVSAISRE